MNVNSDEAGRWYYFVDCASCNEPIPFKQEPSPEDNPIVRVPTMKVRCPHCRKDHTYAGDLISRSQVSQEARLSVVRAALLGEDVHAVY
jgi:hypothetical protein